MVFNVVAEHLIPRRGATSGPTVRASIAGQPAVVSTAVHPYVKYVKTIFGGNPLLFEVSPLYLPAQLPACAGPATPPATQHAIPRPIRLVSDV